MSHNKPAGALIPVGSWNTHLAGGACTTRGWPPEDSSSSFLAPPTPAKNVCEVRDQKSQLC